MSRRITYLYVETPIYAPDSPLTERKDRGDIRPKLFTVPAIGGTSTENVKDLYIVDTTAKSGLTPSPFTFVGSASNEFFNESNWEDADGNNPPTNTIDVGVPIRHSLIIDGNTVVATGGAQQELTFQLGGSLELTSGSMLSSTLLQLEFNPGSGLKLTDATIRFREDVRLGGTNVLTGGMIESLADDVEFNTEHKSLINGTTIRAGNGENVFFDNSATSIFGATIETEDRLGLRYESARDIVRHRSHPSRQVQSGGFS